MRAVLVFVISACAAALIGCTADRPTVTEEGSVTPSHQRVGHVFLVRGLMGVFSTGMDEMRDQLRQQGVASSAIMHTQGSSAAQQIAESPELRNSPVIIIGHSLGADEAVSICRELADNNVTVDLLVTLDPVNAPRVPANVRRAVNYYRSNGVFDLLPLFRGTPLHPDDPRCQLVNVDLNAHEELVEPSTNHFTIDKDTKVQRDIVKQVLAICPSPRQSEAIVAGAKVRPGFTPQPSGSAQVPGSQLH